MISISYTEKRLHLRVPHEVDVFFKPGWKGNKQGIVRDICEQGTFLISHEKMYQGNEIILYMPVEFRGKESLCMLHGRVVRIEKREDSNSYGYGIRFGDLAPGTILLLQKFITSRLPALVEPATPQRPKVA